MDAVVYELNLIRQSMTVLAGSSCVSAVALIMIALREVVNDSEEVEA